MKKFNWIITGALALSFLTISVYFFLFKETDIVSDDLGNITYMRKWGWIQEVNIDINQDGLIDVRGVYPMSIKTVSHHDSFRDHWESSECNGEFDIHVLYDSDGKVAKVEYDSDGNGRFDEVKVGLDGREMLSRIREGGCLLILRESGSFGGENDP